jgi:hypothetical protein
MNDIYIIKILINTIVEREREKYTYVCASNYSASNYSYLLNNRNNISN